MRRGLWYNVRRLKMRAGQDKGSVRGEPGRHFEIDTGELVMRPESASVENRAGGGLVSIAYIAQFWGARGSRRLVLATGLAVLIGALCGAAVVGFLTQERWRGLPAPTGVSAVNGENPGEAIISWQPVSGAGFYGIAWIAVQDAQAVTENGGAWRDAVAFTNIAAATDGDDTAAAVVVEHTLTRLNPGAVYTFMVGSRRNRESAPAWSLPAELYLETGTLQPDAERYREAPVGLTVNETGASDGYTLFASRRHNVAYLIDNAGRMVHRWEDNVGSNNRLLENGNLMGYNDGGVLRETDRAGNVVWSYQHPEQLHHDFVALPNGNVLLLLREIKTPQEAIAAGANPAFVPEMGLAIDTVVEVRPIYPDRAEVVWEWSIWDHLVQDYDAAKANFGRVAEHPELVDLNYGLRELHRTKRSPPNHWLHANGLDYHPELDQIVISARNLGEIWVIDHSTTTEEAAGHSGGNSGRGGDLLYRWGNPRVYRAGTYADQQLFWLHNAHWIPEGLPGAGNILIFNNGSEYEGRYLDYSAVVEITPPTAGYGYARAEAAGGRYGPAGPTWTYTAENPSDFLSYVVSGAQRLPNGNTLSVGGMQGVIFEVPPAGATVWRYVNPVIETGPIYQGDPIRSEWHMSEAWLWDNLIYRVYRYAPDYPGLQYYDLTPEGTVERYRDGGG